MPRREERGTGGRDWWTVWSILDQTGSLRCQYEGRRVDLFGRSLREPVEAEPVAALTRYLNAAGTASARALVAKAVVIVDPAELRGTLVWLVAR